MQQRYYRLVGAFRTCSSHIRCQAPVSSMRSGMSAMENYEEIARRYGIRGTASSIVRIELSELLAALS